MIKVWIVLAAVAALILMINGCEWWINRPPPEDEPN